MFISNWLFFSWVLFHKKTIINKADYYANDLFIEKKISLIRPNITCGKDNHISKEEIEKKENVSKIKEYKFKKYQLQMLENPYISIIEKLLIVKDFEKDNIDSISIYNISNGGLWKDWD